MNLDEELRGTLHTHADDAPDGAGMLDAVRTRAGRLDLRRRLGTAGVAAVAAVAVAVGVPYALGAFGRSKDIPVGGGPVVVETTTSPPPRASTVALGPPAFTPVRFPLNPTWIPPGVGRATEGRIQTGLVRLVYEGTTSGIIAMVSDELYPSDWTPATTTQTTVNGRPATLTTGTTEGRSTARITWQLANQKWVDVSVVGQITAAQLKQYANGLEAQPKPPTPLPFTLALAPVGYQVAYQEISATEFHFCLAPADEVNGDSENLVCTSRNEAPEAHGGEPVQVGDYPGEIHRDHSYGLVKLVVYRPGFEFSVTVSEDGPLNDEDLVRFAAGVTQS